jgi:hypothetical protein
MPTQRERFTDRVVVEYPYMRQLDGSTSYRPPATVCDLRQVTVSDGNPYFRTLRRNGFEGRDIGSQFSTRKFLYTSEYRGKKFASKLAVGTGSYVDGNVVAFVPSVAYWNGVFDRMPILSDSTLDAWGSTAISNVLPTKSKVELATTAAELLSGGLPKILGAGLLKSVIKDHRNVAKHAKAGADEFLNLEFGLKPLISDIQGTAEVIVGAAERLRQLERDSGKLVRRKFRFPTREETFHSVTQNAYPDGWSYAYLWNGNSPKGRLDRWTTYRTDRWFSGAFTYHLDLGERQRNQLYAAADNARLLLGVKLDAEVLWNLTPWSWLADWFGNVGDIATNMSHFSRDKLVMPYGYIMAESTTVDSFRLSGLNWYDPGMPKSVSDSATFVRKQRRPANPFGFGLTDVMLDTRQLAILNALGISKMPRK